MEKEIQPLQKLFKNGQKNPTRCEVCKGQVEITYIKGVIAGHEECLLSDPDMTQVGQNIIDLNAETSRL